MPYPKNHCTKLHPECVKLVECANIDEWSPRPPQVILICKLCEISVDDPRPAYPELRAQRRR